MRVQTLEEVIQPYLHLPTAIQTAILRLETHPAFRLLPRSGIPILRALVSRARATDGSIPVRARIDRLAEAAGVCYRTAQRAMKGFIEIGWISKLGPGRHECGVYQSFEWQFSQAFCELVLLPISSAAHTGNPVTPGEATEMSDGAIYKELSLKKEYREISIKNRGETPIKLPQAVDKIPEETGIRPTGVCKLLGMASRAGHKLEHVYLLAKPYLHNAGAKGSRAFSYLWAMLTTSKQVDYSARVAQAQRTQDPVRQKLSEVARTCRYKKYIHPTKGLRFHVYDGMAEVTDSFGRTETYVGRQMEGIYRGIAAGHLVEVIA